MITKGRFFSLLCIISVVSFLSWAGARIYKYATFQEKIGGYLQNYVESGDMETAEQNLSEAINVLEEQGLTQGQISIFWKDQNCNIGLWYNNLSESRKALTNSLQESKFNQSIILEKQRDGLKGGTKNSSVRVPDGISIYPNNKLFFWWGILSFVAIIGCVGELCYLKQKYKMDEPLLG